MSEPATSNHSDILGIRFDLVDYQVAWARIDSWRQMGQRRYVTITNPHSVCLCRRDAEMALATAGAGLTLPDGVGVILGARVLGHENRGRVTGPTLMLRLCDWGRAHGYRHYFYGGQEGVAEALTQRLCERFPGLAIAGVYCPPFRALTTEEDEDIVRRINDTSPDIVWVGLGAPKQEKWMASHVGRIHASAMIGVGAAFDFHSGRVKWAPAWIRTLGMEWAYRLAQDPKRMWRRNMDSVLFMSGVVAQRLGYRGFRTKQALGQDGKSAGREG